MTKPQTICFWPWSHQFSKWQTYKQPIILGKWSGSPGETGTMECQKRVCEKCGLEQRRDLND